MDKDCNICCNQSRLHISLVHFLLYVSKTTIHGLYSRRLKCHIIPEELKELADDIMHYLKILASRFISCRKSSYFLSTNHRMMLSTGCICEKIRLIFAESQDERSYWERIDFLSFLVYCNYFPSVYHKSVKHLNKHNIW